MDNSHRLCIEWQNQSYACTIKNSQQIRVKSPHNNKNFIKKTPEVNPLKFNNFEAREYDYDSLEKKLLGWDKDD